MKDFYKWKNLFDFLFKIGQNIQYSSNILTDLDLTLIGYPLQIWLYWHWQ